jgi:hypothetical protein
MSSTTASFSPAPIEGANIIKKKTIVLDTARRADVQEILPTSAGGKSMLPGHALRPTRITDCAVAIPEVPVPTAGLS